MDADTPMQNSDDIRDFIIAIDFGTTFSSVAYLGYYDAKERGRAVAASVDCIDCYPYDPYDNAGCYDVPTELWYSQRIWRPPPRHRDTVDRQHDGDDGGPAEDNHQYTNTGSGSNGTSGSSQQPYAPPHAENSRAPVFWGYGVQDQLLEADYNTDHSRHLSRFKLILDESKHTEKIRNGLSTSCAILKKMLLINKDTDLIADYLTQLLQHTKKRLSDGEEYTAASAIEFVLCIPAVWKSEGVRQMEEALTTAVANTGLGKLHFGSIDNLFIVSEPEGAAAWFLSQQKTRLKVGSGPWLEFWEDTNKSRSVIPSYS